MTDTTQVRHPQQPREHPVPCRHARPGDTRHTTWNPSAICDDCQTRT